MGARTHSRRDASRPWNPRTRRGAHLRRQEHAARALLRRRVSQRSRLRQPPANGIYERALARGRIPRVERLGTPGGTLMKTWSLSLALVLLTSWTRPHPAAAAESDTMVVQGPEIVVHALRGQDRLRDIPATAFVIPRAQLVRAAEARVS